MARLKLRSRFCKSCAIPEWASANERHGVMSGLLVLRQKKFVIYVA